jgi:hypothetical protein
MAPHVDAVDAMKKAIKQAVLVKFDYELLLF